MDYARHLAALRHEGAALAGAAREALRDEVPTCPGWTVERLVQHVGHGFRTVTRIVRDHADAEVSFDGLDAPDEGVVTWFEESLDDLVDALANEDPGTPVWNWSGRDLRVAFWARRMAHEVAVHRWDAQRATGREQPVEAELAADGVDELLDVFLPESLGEHPVDGLAATFSVIATDTGDAWYGRLRPDSSDVVRGIPASLPDATLRGTASDLLLAVWGRPVAVEASGDERVTGLLLA